MRRIKCPARGGLIEYLTVYAMLPRFIIKHPESKGRNLFTLTEYAEEALKYKQRGKLEII